MVIIYIFVKKLISVIKLKKRFKEAQKQEKGAKEILINNGYKVLDYQYEIVYKIYKDGEEIKIRITPDYIVKKNGKKYIAEVKTGMSTNIKNRHTRRQLMEYFYSGGMSTLLVDMDKKEIMEIKFKDKSRLWKKISVLFMIIIIGELTYIYFKFI